MSGLLYPRLPAGSLYITARAVGQMSRYRQHLPFSKEAGGVLLGRHLQNGSDCIVDQVTEPMLGDRRRWAGFFRSARHNRAARRRWKKHGETSAYLGSWHTHPESDPKPSSVDFRDWQDALLNDTYEGSALFFVIIGIDQVRIWQGNERGEFCELDLIREHYEEEI